MRDYFNGPQLEYFSQELKNSFIDYARSLYPNEACGFFLEDEFVPCENIAEDKLNDFKISPEVYLKYVDRIKCIVHSHDSYPHGSKKDMIGQINSNIPWGICSLNKNLAVEQFWFFGDQLPVQTLLGRQFIFSAYDCFGLVRDYLRQKDILIPQYPRENFFWESKDRRTGEVKIPEKMLEDGMEEAGFIYISKEELQPGDFFFAKVQATVLNHCGIYVGGNLILHHLYGRFSRQDPMYIYERFMEKYLRYVGVNKC
jgi:proteasome lid subunit RPN8/RPN11